MRFHRLRTRRWISLALFGWLSFASVFGILSVPREAQAQARGWLYMATQTAISSALSACFASPGPPCFAAGALETLRITVKEVLTPAWEFAATTMLMDLLTTVTNRLAYDAAVAITGGGPGQTSLIYSEDPVQAWSMFGMDVAGELVGGLSDMVEKDFGTRFNLCKPSGAITFSLALGIQQTYKPPGAPKCDLTKFKENWSSFVSNIYQNDPNPTQRILKDIGGAFRPGQNELSIAVGLNLGVLEEISRKKSIQFAHYLSQSGFKNVTDTVTGQVRTPAAILQDKFKADVIRSEENTKLVRAQASLDNPDIWLQLLWSAGSTFLNTALSRTVQNVYTGFFEPTAPPDPFRFESPSSAGLAQTKQKFSGLLAVNPVSTTNYNALTEFSVCLIGNIFVRGVNNCVMDTAFASAVTRSAAGTPLSVQEAVKEGYLRGDFPLIPPTDNARNQDPLCYTYGYCYGNLVKLRKARVIPVGWELAAQKNNASDPKTLKQIMDDFENRNSPWYHLIDPNWVLKYPETQCRAIMSGETLATASSGGRAAVCVDTPSCVAENNDGTCKGAYGYCVREKNVWRFKGDACPEQYVTCLDFRNTFTNKSASWLLNTVDYGICSGQNAGCRWYQAGKTPDTKGTETNRSDDTYDWLLPDATYTVASHDTATGERVYFNNNATQCSAAEAGCSRVYKAGTVLRLNALANPSFEDNDDGDTKPDFWLGSSSPGALAQHGSVSVKNPAGFSQERILLTPFAFYTFSVYAKADGGTPVNSTVRVSLVDASSGRASDVDLRNRSFSSVPDGSCAPIDKDNNGIPDGYSITIGNPPEFQRYTCTFTTADKPTFARVELNGINILYDAVQLEAGENASAFTIGYNAPSPETAYLRPPPAYLNCTGAATDPKECANYTQVCAAQDIGCNRYTPENGGPPVPATVSAVDRCPAACVGYTTYKQEAAKYEPEEFPLYFIASKAVACSAQNVGCDSFTNLDTVARGGEGIEHYSDLRACTTPEGALGNSATYFTWEGSDVQGYQLRTWQLLKSDGAAPCTKWAINPSGGNENRLNLVCTDDGGADLSDDACDAHEDIFTNPDCREFYDSAGAIHYRRFSQTVSVNAECHPYRKTQTTQTACRETGGHWTAAGECRYFGLPSESISCPASADGCREYTGGAGRNASVILSEDFEVPTSVSDFTATSGATAIYSSESTASGGHSMRVAVPTANYTSYTGGVEASFDKLGANVVPGKTFVLNLWAKGSGPVQITFKDSGANGAVHDLVNPLSTPESPDELALEGGWRPYTLGPVDTSGSAFSAFGKDTVFSIKAKSANAIFYVDNLRLTQTEENITLIKNSWVVPASCDATPTGVASPQYYLGCQAYTDKDAKRETLYQFTRLCSDKVIGCQQFYSTQNSNAPTGAAYNIRCENTPAEAPVNVTQNTACVVDGKTYCTISVGRSYCVSSIPNGSSSVGLPSSFPYPPTGSSFRLALGPEAIIVPNDAPMYLVDNGTTSCQAASVGCQEVGTPKYAQDKKTVTSFTSSYYLNTPDSYDNILCENEELFCEEWASTKDGNYYFKDPIDQQCEYKTNVKIAGKTYYGWFRKGTSAAEPCYWEDSASGTNRNGRYDLGEEKNIKGGEEFGIWKNGDTFDANNNGVIDPSEVRYEGWAGACERQYDRCTAFIDPTDTREGLSPSGTQYSFVNNESLSDSRQAQSSTPCNGQVSQKQGCALFQNTNILNLTFAAEPSYVLSTHADVLRGDERFALEEPIDCSKPESETTIRRTDGTSVDLCNRRCKYTIGAGKKLVIGNAIQASGSADAYLGSCLVNEDCAPQKASDAQTYIGTCVDIPSLRHQNDTNSVIKVRRDRECAEWLACKSSKASWNTNTNKYEQICEGVDLCSRYSASGGSAACSQWSRRDAVLLSEQAYAKRDVSWSGLEYSGYSIPNVLPVELLDQVNVAAPTAPAEIRLAYVAGLCELPTPAPDIPPECKIGFCRDGKQSCSKDIDCLGTDKCVIGYCQNIVQSNTGGLCARDVDCPANFKCDLLGRCVDRVLPDPGAATCDSSLQCSGGGTCQFAATTMIGSCINSRCLTDIQGRKFAPENAVDIACRGYPEADSPFPSGGDKSVVTKWVSGEPTPKNKGDRPSVYKGGFQNVKTFAPVKTSAGVVEVSGKPIDSCRYIKTKYGSGAEQRYYPLGTSTSEGIDAAGGLGGICLGGDKAGAECTDDAGCQVRDNQGNLTSSSGTCARLSGQETMYGWVGYCLEKDSSTQIYGSQNDRACLTWLPIDQLRGQTDLNGKLVQAGFPPQDLFYCADIDVSYDVWTSDVACLEGHWPKCDAGNFGQPNFDAETWRAENSKIDDISHLPNNIPNIRCPAYHFAIVGTCGEDKGPQGYCTGMIMVDDEFPYFCVPELAYKEGTETRCLRPGASGQMNTDVNVAVSVGNSNDGTEMFVIPTANFNGAKNFYKDCRRFGISSQLYSEMGYVKLLLDASPRSLVRDGEIAEWKVQTDPYLMCGSLVQVSDDDLTNPLNQAGSLRVYNQAWTDRLQKQSNYTTANPGGFVSYKQSDMNPPFGVSLSPEVFRQQGFSTRGRPISIAACQQMVDLYTGESGRPQVPGNQYPMGRDACSAPETETEYSKPEFLARAYQDVYLGCNPPPRNEVAPCFPNFERMVVKRKPNPVEGAKDMLRQIFARSFGLESWNSVLNTKLNWAAYLANPAGCDSKGGCYLSSPLNTNWQWAEAAYEGDKVSRDPEDPKAKEGIPTAPVVLSVGECINGLCQEQNPGTFSVNEQDGVDDNGIVTGADGQLRATVSFFTYANKNQMPIRKVIVDWGDGDRGQAATEKWPRTSQGGSNADDNFYKNQRGADAGKKPICGTDKEGWGTDPQACDSSYVSFIHDYTCSGEDVATLPECEVENGRLINSPCTGGDLTVQGAAGKCVFQPRVHVMDNWGWCTGTCIGGTDGTPGCFDGSQISGASRDNQCDIVNCPGGSLCGTNGSATNQGDKLVNPWTNFKGYVIVEPPGYKPQ